MDIESDIKKEISSLPNLQGPEEKLWGWLLASGIFTLILGMAAIILPFVATLTIELLLGTILIIAGIVHILHVFKARRPKGLFLQLLTAALYGLVGILLVAFPLQGALTLTLLLTMMFIIAGTFKIALSLRLRPIPTWGWLMFSGLVSIALGVFIWMGLPGTATWAIGLLVGIELLFSGWSMTMFALSLRDDYKDQSLRKEPTL